MNPETAEALKRYHDAANIEARRYQMHRAALTLPTLADVTEFMRRIRIAASVQDVTMIANVDYFFDRFVGSDWQLGTETHSREAVIERVQFNVENGAHVIVWFPNPDQYGTQVLISIPSRTPSHLVRARSVDYAPKGTR